MNRPAGLLVFVLTMGILTGLLSAQAPTRPTAGESAKPLRLKDLTIDRAKRQVVVEAAVSLRQGALEFALCTEGTKDYESLLSTKAAPSSLHAALLALGLAPGKPAHWTTPADKKPVFVPPKGAMLDVSVRWKDAEGKPHECPVTDWMLAAGTQKKADPTRWVFVGSDVLDDGRYWADLEGHHISVANFASSVVDVPFESSDKAALLQFTANADAMPAKGTKVEVVFTAVQGAENDPDARISLAIDALGRITMDGAAVAVEEVPAAAKKFLARHSAAVADVRMDPRALVYDRERLQAALAEAGLGDVTFRMTAVADEILPRSPAEAARALEYWKGQFAQAKDLIVDPAEDAKATLKHIEQRRKQVESISELWADYAARLQALLKEYQAAKAKTEGGGS